MKSIDNIIKFQNLQADIWGYTTNLLSILQWFDGEDATDKAITSGLLVNDATDRFTMWCDLVNEHYKIWTEWISTIDLDSVDRELYDDCPDNATLTNRLRIVKLRAGDMWNKNEYDSQFHKVLYSFDRLKALILATYEIEEDDADKMAGQIKQRLTLRLINVMQMQMIVQSIISKGENLLNPQPDTLIEQRPKDPIFNNYELFNNDWVVTLFQDMIKEQIISISKGYFRWHWDRPLLLWFCKQISELCGLTKYKKDKPQIDWLTFNNMFICKVWNSWVIHANNDLRKAWQDWQKNVKSDKSDDNGNPLPPKGWNIIEGLISKNFK